MIKSNIYQFPSYKHSNYTLYYFLNYPSRFNRAAKDPIKRTVQGVKDGFWFILHLFSVSNIKHQIAVAQTKSVPELFIGFFKMIFYAFYYSGLGVTLIIKYFLNILMSLMRGSGTEEIEAPPEPEASGLMRALPALPQEEPPGTVQAFGLDISKEENGQYKLAPHESPAASPSSSMEETGESSPEDAAAAGEHGPEEGQEPPITLVDLLGGEAAKRAAQERSEAQKLQEAAMATIEAETKKSSAEPKEPAAVTQIDFSQYTHKIVSFLARNFYNLKYVALVLAFCINFMLLFYKVTTFGEDEGGSGEGELDLGFGSGGSGSGLGAILEGSANGEGEEGEEEDPLESVHVDEDFYYMEHVLRIAAILHSTVSLAMLIAYYHLKVRSSLQTRIGGNRIMHLLSSFLF